MHRKGVVNYNLMYEGWSKISDPGGQSMVKLNWDQILNRLPYIFTLGQKVKKLRTVRKFMLS